MTTPAGGCPLPHSTGHRKSSRDEQPDAPAIERRSGVWHLRSYAAVRQVLRDSERIRQDAFGGTSFIRFGKHQPIIFQDGDLHKEQRTAIARYFTPKTVSETYQPPMEAFSDTIIADFHATGHGDLSAMGMRLAVDVAALVVGLTDSRSPGMAQRIEALLSMEYMQPGPRARRTIGFLKNQLHTLRFYTQDVRPAIAARRNAPRDDVISHLLGKGYNQMEILIECLTYAVAGMVTTREYISMAAWHLLENDSLRREYLAATESERHRILHEILRVEPVAGHLWRRTIADITIEHEGETHHVPAGARLNLHIREANADPDAVGSEPLEVCPHRKLAPGVQPPAASFGDGAHRCPGSFLAIYESDVFLQRLLRVPLRMTRPPRLIWNDVLESYELRDFEITVDPTMDASLREHDELEDQQDHRTAPKVFNLS